MKSAVSITREERAELLLVVMELAIIGTPCAHKRHNALNEFASKSNCTTWDPWLKTRKYKFNKKSFYSSP